MLYVGLYSKRESVYVCVCVCVVEIHRAHWTLNNEVHGKRWRSYRDACPHSSELARLHRKTLQKH